MFSVKPTLITKYRLIAQDFIWRREITAADDELSTVPIANAKKSKKVILPVSGAELEKKCLDRIREGTKHNTTGPFALGKSGQKYEIAKVHAVGKICMRSFKRRF
jgi:hypothetical protein